MFEETAEEIEARRAKSDEILQSEARQITVPARPFPEPEVYRPNRAQRRAALHARRRKGK